MPMKKIETPKNEIFLLRPRTSPINFQATTKAPKPIE